MEGLHVQKIFKNNNRKILDELVEYNKQQFLLLQVHHLLSITSEVLLNFRWSLFREREIYFKVCLLKEVKSAQENIKQQIFFLDIFCIKKKQELGRIQRICFHFIIVMLVVERLNLVICFICVCLVNF
eukprot:TRINITY_DN5422_c0_g1_i1.p3 TRINITY_DN5422_c0_g1~~TRINITY_DN5422_c0_g1_i1.p3  ORF type:complete len:128 (-),score=6.64 TRINITY_DN5422_c0_g1_i1:347-730(-)